jgi:pimeloyl-ACP methyl ester carboxylesterase
VADRARAMIAARPTPSADVWRQRLEIVNALGDRRNDLYIKDSSRYPDPFPSESLLPLLTDVRQPALLIKGSTDPAASWPEVERFRADVPHGRVEIFEESSHFPQMEEPERYAERVRTFVAG